MMMIMMDYDYDSLAACTGARAIVAADEARSKINLANGVTGAGSVAGAKNNLANYADSRIRVARENP